MNFNLILFKEILHHLPNDYKEENYDSDRFGPYQQKGTKPKFIKSILVNTLNRFHYYNIKGLKMSSDASFATIERSFGKIAEKLPYFEYLYNVLENEESKDLLLKIVSYRILGYKKVKLPSNTSEYWKHLKDTENLIEGKEEIDINFLHFKLRKYNLHKIGFEISAFLNGQGILFDFILEQYKYKSKNKQIEVKEGDVVIDAGACYGDTALYFACKAGEKGRVYSFEFIPDNIKVLRKNFSLNPKLEKKIELIENPLWSESGIPVYYLSNGPGSQVSFDKIPNASGESVTKTIDDLVTERNISKVDFIKMDIEGAELNALNGAIKTIKKHKPKLAICLYHSEEDFGTIPKFINELNLGYKFYLGHYTIYQEETVLFAIAQ